MMMSEAGGGPSYHPREDNHSNSSGGTGVKVPQNGDIVTSAAVDGRGRSVGGGKPEEGEQNSSSTPDNNENTTARDASMEDVNGDNSSDIEIEDNNEDNEDHDSDEMMEESVPGGSPDRRPRAPISLPAWASSTTSTSSTGQQLQLQLQQPVSSLPALAAAKKPSILPSLARRAPPKMRIKLSLRTLPTLANRKAIPKPKVAGSQAFPDVEDDDDDPEEEDNDDEDEGGSSNDDEGSVKATVVDSDDGGDEDDDDVVIARVIGESASIAESGGTSGGSARRGSSAAAGGSGGTTSKLRQSSTQPPKRRSQPGTRPIRMPPIASPALLMPQPVTSGSSGAAGGADRDSSSHFGALLLSVSSAAVTTTGGGAKKANAESKAYVTPASVFDHSMEAAGYTTEARTKRPHRGSSVKREVGDMFDSNVALTQRFPPLVPRDLLKKAVDGVPLPRILIDSIPRGTRKRKFSDMVPPSLVINYPEEYVQKRVDYVRLVDAREKAIVMFQESQDAADTAADEVAYNGAQAASSPSEPSANSGTAGNNSNNKKVIVPPIPESPTPPSIKELVDFPADLCKDEHPLYPPRNENFASHLDPQAFHITNGRYFGLATNNVADPNFVGPNAPGLSGMSSSSGLSTSSAGGGAISGAMALTLATTYNGVTAGTAAALKSSSRDEALTAAVSALHDRIKKEAAVGVDSDSPAKSAAGGGAGPKPTATSADLRKIMEQDDDLASRMKLCIIRAAVHASRSGRHWQPFMGPNREIYPDVSKAFATHAGVKPCQRCKSNKQGAYHCRLRRRHRQLDWDGGDSLSSLIPLFSAPMDSLVERL